MLDTRTVIPAKAGIQVTLLWIPASAGKDNRGETMSRISANVELLTKRHTNWHLHRWAPLRRDDARVDQVADQVEPDGVPGLGRLGV